ncbi:MAG: hypothetical protein IPJ88_02675 [Myxococcales bacterium]|nr:MAG: hypothetical protein IPJ88_02675 [Myxococcales bacterium]
MQFFNIVPNDRSPIYELGVYTISGTGLTPVGNAAGICSVNPATNEANCVKYELINGVLTKLELPFPLQFDLI